MSCCKGKNNLPIIAQLSEKVWWIENNILFRTKLRNITRDDAIHFARENGIRRPDAIICDVVSSLKQFRAIATKYGVSEQWTGRVEATIIDHLKSWGRAFYKLLEIIIPVNSIHTFEYFAYLRNTLGCKDKQNN